jgi:hypothetical protein
MNLRLYTQLVEVVVSPGGSTNRVIQFIDQPYLRGAFIYGLEVFTINDMALSPQGNAVISDTVMQESYLNLYTTDPLKGSNNLNSQGNVNTSSSGLYIQNLPLSVLHTLQNSNGDPFERQRFEMNGQSIIWEKSNIILGAAIGNSSNVSFLFNVDFALNPSNTTN